VIYNSERLSNQLGRHGLDAVIASTRENIRYFTGFEAVVKTLNPHFGQCYALVTAAEPTRVHIVHSLGEIDQVLDARCDVGEVFTYGVFYREQGRSELSADDAELSRLSSSSRNHDSGETALVRLLQELGLEHARIGIDEDGIRALQLAGVRAGVPEADISPAAALLRSVRAVKTTGEVVALSRAAVCVEKAIEDVLGELREGISELEIASVFRTSVARQGGLAVLPMIKVGRHAVGGQRTQKAGNVLRAGDVLWFDCDIVLDGYWADIARVFAFRERLPAHARFEALHAGQAAANAGIEPGMTGADACRKTMAAVHRAGFADYRRHHVGHGIGLEPYERPILAPDNEDVIEAGMVLSVETPYYEYGLGALHVEDPIHVSEQGNELLSASPGALRVVG